MIVAAGHSGPGAGKFEPEHWLQPSAGVATLTNMCSPDPKTPDEAADGAAA
jgi:hypothetical protein